MLKYKNMKFSPKIISVAVAVTILTVVAVLAFATAAPNFGANSVGADGSNNEGEFDLNIYIKDAPVLIEYTTSDKISASYDPKHYEVTVDQSSDKWSVDVSVINSNTNKSAVLYIPQEKYNSMIIDVDNGMYSGGIIDAANISAKVKNGGLDFSLDKNFEGSVGVEAYNSILNISSLDSYTDFNVEVISDKDSLGAAPNYFDCDYQNGKFTYSNGDGSNLMDISLQGGSVGCLQ